MAQKGGGVIVNCGSTNGLVGESGDTLAAYCASKGGVSLLTKQMAIELAPHNIRVNAVCPGWTDTPMNTTFISDTVMWNRYMDEKIPMRRIGKAEEQAAVFAFLASDDASYITGELVVVDGGQMAF
jgi:NAD(P)-dependent dehydrogenase (short-subunit alcohol dehydrogenase family)